MESAEEAMLENQYPDEIKRRQATRHSHTPPLRGFEKALPPGSGKDGEPYVPSPKIPYNQASSGMRTRPR